VQVAGIMTDTPPEGMVAAIEAALSHDIYRRQSVSE
jgi:hypothetical protein